MAPRRVRGGARRGGRVGIGGAGGDRAQARRGDGRRGRTRARSHSRPIRAGRASGWCGQRSSCTTSARRRCQPAFERRRSHSRSARLDAARLAWLQQMITGDVWVEKGAAKTFVAIADQLLAGGDRRGDALARADRASLLVDAVPRPDAAVRRRRGRGDRLPGGRPTTTGRHRARQSRVDGGRPCGAEWDACGCRR